MMYTVFRRMKKAIILVSCIVLIAAILYISKINTPKAPQTTTLKATPTVQQDSSLKDVFIEEIGLSFKYPSNLTFRKEIADDAGKIRFLGFYLEAHDGENLTYQLYGLYQLQYEATNQDLEKAKIGMDKNSITEVSIAGYRGIEGLTTGPKAHYSTIILKDNRLFSFSTTPISEENKNLTDQIAATFKFK
jgi:hypothetical protein